VEVEMNEPRSSELSREDFVWYARRNEFIYLPTKEHWVKAGVQAVIGKDGVDWVLKNRMVLKHPRS
jgi:hypothetical protein